jgi:hypothetical protein
VTGQWVGIDPGSRYTGIVARNGKQCLHAAVIDANDDPVTYRTRICQGYITALMTFADDRDASVAIESISAPKPFIDGRKTFTRPADLITLGRILGYLEHALPHAVLVDPDHHGSRPWGTYPDELITAGERRTLQPLKTAGQSSQMRHARSAWDVTLTAERAARLTGARP